MTASVRGSVAYDPDAQGMSLTGTVPVQVRLTGVACGKRRNDVTMQMVEPQACKEWPISSDEAKWHGGDESAPKPLDIFAAGILMCFMTQMRTFARACAVEVRGLRTTARMDWALQRDGSRPYTTSPGRMRIDIELDSDSPLAAQLLLVRTAAAGCPAEATLRDAPVHRLLHRGEWVACESDAGAERGA